MRLLMLVTAALAGCASVPGATGLSRSEVVNRVWTLRTLQGERLSGQRIATLRLDYDGAVTGTLACNTLGPSKLRWTRLPPGSHGTIDTGGAGAGIITTAKCGNTSAVRTADRFWQLMNTAKTWSLEHGGLRVTFADNTDAYLVLTSR
jgi:hypothetical protein